MYIGILRIYYKKFNSLIYQFAYQANMVRMVVRCQNISNITDYQGNALPTCNLIHKFPFRQN